MYYTVVGIIPLNLMKIQFDIIELIVHTSVPLVFFTMKPCILLILQPTRMPTPLARLHPRDTVNPY